MQYLLARGNFYRLLSYIHHVHILMFIFLQKTIDISYKPLCSICTARISGNPFASNGSAFKLWEAKYLYYWCAFQYDGV